MKNNFAFSVVSSIVLLPLLISCGGGDQGWDPEADIQQQNSRDNEKEKICSLLKNNSTHIRNNFETLYLSGKTVYGKYWKGQSCMYDGKPRTLGKSWEKVDERGMVCKHVYKIVGTDLVHYERCSGAVNTLKKVYQKI